MSPEGLYTMLSTYVKQPGFNRDIKSMVMSAGAELSLAQKQSLIKRLCTLVGQPVPSIEEIAHSEPGQNSFFKKDKSHGG